MATNWMTSVGNCYSRKEKSSANTKTTTLVHTDPSRTVKLFRKSEALYKLQEIRSVGFVADGNAPLTSSTMVLPGFSNFRIIGQPSLR